MRLKIALARTYQWIMTTTSMHRVTLDMERPNAVILLAPDYGNIGDLAIGHAQEQYLKKVLPQYSVQSIPLSQTYRALRSLRRRLRPSDLILLVGGGNMGDLYPRLQLGREFVAHYLGPRSVVSFPQSIIYLDRPGRTQSEVREARALAASSTWLTLFARERESLTLMKSFYPGEVGFAPDIVLSLISEFQELPDTPRSHALLALREDSERALNAEDHANVRTAAEHVGPIIERDHGVSNTDVNRGDISELPLKTLDLYRSSALVITDRLHGMIFAAITGTPCVVLPNTNHKITGTYADWIAESCPFIALIRTTAPDELTNAISRVTAPKSRAAFRDVRFDFSELESAILKSVVREV